MLADIADEDHIVMYSGILTILPMIVYLIIDLWDGPPGWFIYESIALSQSYQTILNNQENIVGRYSGWGSHYHILGHFDYTSDDSTGVPKKIGPPSNIGDNKDFSN